MGQDQLNDVYADLLGAHLLATVRETYAVAPSVTRLRIIGSRRAPSGAIETLFDVDTLHAVGDWSDDDYGSAVLESAEWGLKCTRRAHEVAAWPPGDLRTDAAAVMSSV